MEASMCRICLVQNIPLTSIINTKLLQVYERLTQSKHLPTAEHTPLLACYICYAHLRNSQRLMQKCIQAQAIFRQMVESGLVDRSLMDSSHHTYSQTPVVILTDRTFSNTTQVKLEPACDDKQELKDLLGHSDDNDTVEVFDIEDSHQKMDSKNYSINNINSYQDSNSIRNRKFSLNKHIQALLKSIKSDINQKQSDNGSTRSNHESNQSDIKQTQPDNESTRSDHESNQSDIKQTQSDDSIQSDNKHMQPYNETSRSDIKNIQSLMCCQTNINQTHLDYGSSQSDNDMDFIQPESNHIQSLLRSKQSNVDQTESDNGTTQSDNGCIRSDNGSTQSDDGSTQSDNECPQSDNGSTQSDSDHKLQDLCDPKLSTVEKTKRTKNVKPGKMQAVIQREKENIVLNKTTNISETENKHKCTVCSSVFTYKANLSRHMRLHTANYYQCDICKKNFKQKHYLKCHMKIHTGVKPYRCNFCSKTFTEKNALNRHNRLHTGHKPYECEICHKSFGISSHLKEHFRIHTGEKPFKCFTCNQRFNHKHQLVTHNRIHTGEKPYQCNQCSKKFVRKGYLAVHIRTHTNETSFPCDKCDRCFNSKRSLISHIRVHTGETPRK